MDLDAVRKLMTADCESEGESIVARARKRPAKGKQLQRAQKAQRAKGAAGAGHVPCTRRQALMVDNGDLVGCCSAQEAHVDAAELEGHQ